jgi:hypothetical protein
MLFNLISSSLVVVVVEEAVVTNKLVRTPGLPDFCSDGCRDILK